jgi:uncharacterized integral membrane protein
VRNVPKDEPVPQERRGVDGRLIVGGIVLVLLLFFVFQNTEEKTLNFLFFDITAPMWLMLAITVVISMAIGFLLGRRRTKRD